MGRTARALGSVVLLVALTGGPAGARHVQARHGLISADGAGIRTPSRSARCAPAPGRAHVRPPAAIVFTTRCGRYELSRDGSVIRLGPRPRTDRRIEIEWTDGIGAGVDRRGVRGHLVLYRDGQPVWTSTRTFQVLRTPHYLDMVAIGSHSVAFSFAEGRLWVAQIDGTEHPVARDELPEMWTHDGDLVTASWRGDGARLRLRASNGRLLRTITPWTYRYAIDQSDGSIVYLARGRLLRFDGEHRRTVADLRPLRLGWIRTDIELLDGGLIWLAGTHRAASIQPDGRIATIGVPTWPWRSRFGPPGYPAVDPSTGHVAFVRTRSKPPSEAVYALTPEGSAHRLYEHAADLGGCGRDVTLAWHGRWLLYATSERQGAVIDVTGDAAPVALTDLMRRLPGAHDRDFGVQAAWAQEGGRA